MEISIELIERMAEWSKLDLDQEEKAALADQLSKIFEQLETIEKLDIDGQTIDYSATVNWEALREDKAYPSMNIDLILKNAPDTHENMISLPRVLD